MSKPDEATAIILIVSDSNVDAALVKTLLDREFEHVYTSTDPDRAVEDFERCRPDVLMLVFNTLEKSERYYLGLYRLSGKSNLHAHRTVILCNKDEVGRVYELCKKEYFDDYVLFWPMTHDAPRLPMSIHHALRDLSATRGGGPSAAEFAAQARRMAELERSLELQMTRGEEHIGMATRAMEQAEQGIDAALDGLTRRLTQGNTDVSEVRNADSLEREIHRLKQAEIAQLFHTTSRSMQPLKQWADEFRQVWAPHLESVRSIHALAESVQPSILVVDDDALQRKMVGRILDGLNYRLVFAGGGVEALRLLRKMRPDLILMDVMMPDLDGMETTRRLKAVPAFAGVPVVMVTGKSEEHTVRDCLKAGAADFVVKPFDRDTLIAKVARMLQTTAPAATRSQ